MLVGREKQDRIRKENLHRYARGKKHKEKKRHIVDYIVKVTDVIGKKQELLAQRTKDLMQLRQTHITDLTTYIFPVTDVRLDR